MHAGGRSSKENADFVQVPEDTNDETTTQNDDNSPTTPAPEHNNNDDDAKDDVPVGPTNPRPTKKWEDDAPSEKPASANRPADRSDVNAERYSNQNMTFTEQVGELL